MLMSQSRFAAKLGLSRQYINKLVHKGIIQTHDGKRVDDVEAERAMREYEDPHRENQRELNKAAKKSVDLFDASQHYASVADMSDSEREILLQKQREKLDALQKEAETLGVDKEDVSELDSMDIKALNRAILQQELRIKRSKADESEKKSIAIEDVEKSIFSASRIVRDGLLGIPARLAARLAVESDPHKCRTMLEVEITRQLENLSEIFNES
jgi:plasmid maintenance system antidote protein VapI